MTIEQVVRIVFDGNDYTRNVAQAAQERSTTWRRTY